MKKSYLLITFVAIVFGSIGSDAYGYHGHSYPLYPYPLYPYPLFHPEPTGSDVQGAIRRARWKDRYKDLKLMRPLPYTLITKLIELDIQDRRINEAKPILREIYDKYVKIKSIRSAITVRKRKLVFGWLFLKSETKKKLKAEIVRLQEEQQRLRKEKNELIGKLFRMVG